MIPTITTATTASTIGTTIESPKRRELVRLSLPANVTWSFGGNLLYGASQWALLVLLAKLGTPEILGRFALALAIVTPVFQLTNLQLRPLYVADTSRQFPAPVYFQLRIVTVVVTAMALAGGALLLADFELAMVVTAIVVARAAESLSDIAYARHQRAERMDRIAKSLMLRGLVSVSALGTVLWLTGSLIWGCLGLAAARVAVFLLLDSSYMNIRNCGAASPPRAFKKLCRLSLPLAATMMLLAIQEYLPRYFVKLYLDDHALGIFAALAQLPLAGLMITRALGDSASPRLARQYSRDRFTATPRILWKLLGLGAILGVGGIVLAVTAGRPLLRFLYGAEYADYAGALTLLMVAGAIACVTSMLGYAATARWRLMRQPLANLISLLVLMTAGVALLPYSGLAGISWAIVLSSIALAVGYAWVLFGTQEAV